MVESIESPNVEVLAQGEQFVKEAYGVGTASQALVHVEVGKTQQNPFEKPNEKDTTFVLDGFSRDGENVMFINPNHGNEPFILGVNIALSINQILKANGYNEAEIVVPLLYPGRQEKILKEEFGAQSGRIHLDEAAGEMMRATMFQAGDFGGHLDKVNRLNQQMHDQMREHLSRSVRTTTLASGDRRDFNGRNIVLDINTGARFPATDNSYFAFPALLSELLGETLKTDLPFDKRLLSAVQKQAYDLESQYRQKFIPDIHTFSYQGEDYDRSGKEFTPPMKHPISNPPAIDSEGIYVMLSGTGSGVENVMASAKDLGLDVYHSPFVNMEVGTAALPDVIGHPNIKGVFGRMGWGTGWICQLAEKPFIVIPHIPTDDPEIYFNIKTLEAERLGKVYEGQQDIVRQALGFTGDIRRLNESIYKRYGTLDGVDYIASKIVQDLHQRRAQQFPTV